MTEIIARGRPAALPSSVAIGVAASLVLSGCNIPFRGADPERDAATGASTTTDAGTPADSADETPATGTPDPTTATTPTAADVTEDDADAGADASDDESPAEDDEEPAPAPFYANTLPDYGDAAGGNAGTLTDILTAPREGYDQVVLVFTGPGTPAWHVRYVDFVIGDPSGEPLDVEGAAVLEVTLRGVQYPDDAPGAYDGASRVHLDGSSVTEVLFNSIFEGQLQAFVGVGPSELPFRAYRLTNPARVVIEVQHQR